jgi:hypothetical protein
LLHQTRRLRLLDEFTDVVEAGSLALGHPSSIADWCF